MSLNLAFRRSILTVPSKLLSTPISPSVLRFQPQQARLFTQSISRMADAKSEPGSVHMIESNEEFKKYITESQGVVILDAFAEWCGPCKMISPLMSQWAQEYKGAKFYKFDVDQLPDVAQELGIQAMPTFIFYKDGNLDQTVVGAHVQKLKDTIATVAST